VSRGSPRLDLPVRARDDLQGPRAAASTNHKKLAETLHKIDLKDGPAKYFPDGRVKFEENGRRVGAELCIVQWQKNRPVAVSGASPSRRIWPKS
jgi:branched-chain amino acid transport system substrate-binding protein